MELFERRANDIIELFDKLPSQVHRLEALDILQIVVNSVIKKITCGSVTAVKFVPVSEQTTGNVLGSVSFQGHIDIDIKQEPDDWASYSRETTVDVVTEAEIRESPGTPTSQAENADDTNVNHSDLVISDVFTADENKQQVSSVKDFPIISPTESSQKSPSYAKTLPKIRIKLKIPKKQSNSGTPKKSVSKNTPKKSVSKNTTKKSLSKKTPKSKSVVKSKHKENKQGKDVTDQNLSDVTIKSEPHSDEGCQKQAAPKGSVHGGKNTKEEAMKIFPASFYSPDRKKRRKLTGTAKFECEDCDYKTNIKFQYKGHRILHTKEERYTCSVCHKIFTAAGSLKRHMLTHKDVEERPHACPMCPKKFCDLASLRIHSTVHTGQKPFKCPVKSCGKVYTCHSNLIRHRRVHTGETPYACRTPGCEAKFRDQSSLKLHELKHTGEKPWLCGQCGLAFRTSSDKLRHERTHSNEKKYKCEICKKKFTQGQGLKTHMKIHADIRPFECELCHKRLRCKSGLQHHMLSHAGVKNFTCDTCGKSFTTKSYLESHQVLHTKEMPFKCKTCGKRFNQLSNLKRHERIHSDKIRYTCKYCNKGFKYINSWRYHVESIHEGVKHQCDRCGESFHAKRTLKVHRCSAAKNDQEAVIENSDERLEESDGDISLPDLNGDSNYTPTETHSSSFDSSKKMPSVNSNPQSKQSVAKATKRKLNFSPSSKKEHEFDGAAIGDVVVRLVPFDCSACNRSPMEDMSDALETQSIKQEEIDD